MKISKQAEREARQLFRLCLVDGNVDRSRVRLVAQGVMQSKRRGYLLLLESFRRLIAHKYARHAAEIESAVPLSPNLRTRVQAGLTSIYGPRLSLSFRHNPALIGGMRIKVGSDVYDGSVRCGLAALARSFGISITDEKQAER